MLVSFCLAAIAENDLGCAVLAYLPFKIKLL